MKRVVACTLALCVVLLCFTAEKVYSEIADSVIRLHIIANSDSAADQVLKLRVRDFVLERYGEALKAETKEEALSRIYTLLPEILKDVKSFSGQKVQVCMQESEFPTKYYGTLRLPAGNYLALKIILGEGKGKNWWCVMYPPLCFSGAACVTDNEKLKQILTKEEYKLITSDKTAVLYKFKAVEIWNKLKTK